MKVNSCLKHSVIAVWAYFVIGYRQFRGFVPGTHVLTLWPNMLNLKNSQRKVMVLSNLLNSFLNVSGVV